MIKSTEQHAIEIIDLATFAGRMQVAETTVWKWIRSGKLKPGRHFIKFDRVIRFAWGAELIDRLLEDSLELSAGGEDDPSNTETKRRHPVRNGQQPLNLTY